MNLWLRLDSPRERWRWGALAAIVLLAAMALAFPPDGANRAQMAQFVGRFHLLTVHFPIALILLVPVLEIAGRDHRLPHLRASVDFVLVLAMISSVAAAFLGWCLARSSGYSGRLVTQHMWGGLLTAVACWVCWTLRQRIAGQQLSVAYMASVVVAVLVVSWTGYRGGQISQGENHLTEALPAGLRGMFEPRDAAQGAVDRSTFYGGQIAPVLDAKCVGCHSASKHKGNLRLDSYDGIMRGGKDGPVIKAGDAKGSELCRRITLPPGADGAMPPEGKQPLTADEVNLIEAWINAGASATTPAGSVRGVAANSAPSKPLSFDMPDPAAVAKERAPLASAVAQLQKQYPGILNYESRGSAGLVLDASLLREKFSDADLAAFQPVSGAMVAADLSFTSITDRSGAVLDAMRALQSLKLMHTKITDATVLQLGDLKQLQSLSVFDTAVTPASLAIVPRLPKLEHLYVGETKVHADASLPANVQKVLQF